MPGRTALLAASPVALAIVAYQLHTQAATLDVRACVEQNVASPLLPDYWLLAGSIVALLAGRVFGPRLHRTPEQRGAQQLSSIVGILATMLFFAAVAAALVYEAVGVRVSKARLQQPADVQQLEPITHYVRCAIYYDLLSHWNDWHTGLWSVFAIALISFLVGYWLWSMRGARVPQGEPSTATTDGWPWPVAMIVTFAIGAAFIWGLLHFLNAWIDGTPVVTQSVIGSPDTGASFRDGIRAVIAFVFVGFVCIAVLDFAFAVEGWTPIALRMQDWSRANPWFVFVLLLIIGALLTHFIANLIHYPIVGQGGSGLELSTFLASDVLVIVLFGLTIVTASIASKAAGPLRVRGVDFGIVSFELAGTGRRAAQIVQLWHRAGKLAIARRAIHWDFALIGAYTAGLTIALVLIARWLTINATGSDVGAVSAVGPTFVALTLIGGGFDVVEDLAMLRILHLAGATSGPGSASGEQQLNGWARLAAVAATGKFTLLFLVLVVVIAGVGLLLGQLGGSLFGG
jgi:hypothetical protein